MTVWQSTPISIVNFMRCLVIPKGASERELVEEDVSCYIQLPAQSKAAAAALQGQGWSCIPSRRAHLCTGTAGHVGHSEHLHKEVVQRASSHSPFWLSRMNFTGEKICRRMFKVDPSSSWAEVLRLLSSCLWIPVSLDAGLWTSKPPRQQPCCSCWSGNGLDMCSWPGDPWSRSCPLCSHSGSGPQALTQPPAAPAWPWMGIVPSLVHPCPGRGVVPREVCNGSSHESPWVLCSPGLVEMGC